jgi:hypothetical protein
MPDATVIDSDQRAGLYELVRNHLGSIEDFWVALERTRDFARAERLGREFAEDFRLLEDIGWAPDEPGETFALTLPAEELAALARRLREEAGQVLAGASNHPDSPEDEATDERFAAGLAACEVLLTGCGSSGLPSEVERELAPLPISGEQREILRDLMTHRLFAAGGERVEKARAEGIGHLQIASEFSQDLRLMLDVGWREEEGSGPGELTMPSAELGWTLERMRIDAEAALGAEPPGRCAESERSRRRRFRHAADTCAALLAALGLAGGPNGR